MQKLGKSVLVVDDHAMSIKLLQQILEAEGFDVFSASSGEEAITFVREFKPDLTLLDIILAGINGYKTCQVLKIVAPDMPIIFLSTVPDKDKGLQLGAVDYIIKPFQMQDVVARVKKHTGVAA
jgi:DNA-binding response OmpR family regulator